ncbi:hypothetical protein AWC32_03130 [Mycobacterium xenopi]|nr:hypothetical protein AWC32_03130 [Mycobacterium xenopi]
MVAKFRCEVFGDTPGIQPVAKIRRKWTNYRAQRNLPAIFSFSGPILPAGAGFFIQMIAKDRTEAPEDHFPRNRCDSHRVSI